MQCALWRLTYISLFPFCLELTFRIIVFQDVIYCDDW